MVRPGTKPESEETVGDDALVHAFGHEVPPSERELWERLTASQRERASGRLAAITGWAGGEGGLSATAAAALAGLSLSRFYRLASEWRAGPSLSVIGTFAAPLARRSKFEPDVVNALQAKVPAVVRLNGDASISRLVDLLVTAAGVPSGKLPGSTKLREIVQAELRRVAATHDAGTAIVFDAVAVSIARADGRPHVMFACLDTGTRAILGIALGDVSKSVVGHAASADDALRSVEIGALALPWGRRLARVELTAGLDLDDCRDLVDRLGKGGSAANFQLSTRPGRFGRYVRKLAGPRLGRVSITPTRTAAGGAMAPDPTPWSDLEALAELRAAADAHNASLPALSEPAGDGGPPPSLLQALRELRTA